MSDETTPFHSVVGGWLGTYYYRSPVQLPVRFEATFTAAHSAAGAFGGTILDDGAPGEAVVSHGLQTGRHLRFTKTYMLPGFAPVRYRGTLSEDGRMISGTWKIEISHGGRVVPTTGYWEAVRRWSEDAATEQIPEGSQQELTPLRESRSG